MVPFSRFIVVCFVMFFCLHAQAKRVALVIGNDNYITVSKLQKAGNDAYAMARELRSAGFAVQLHQNLNYLGTVKAIEAFANGISGGDEVVFFYAGHGVQIKNGSYLLPTDIEVSSESEVEKTAYDLLTLTEKLADAKPAFSLVIIDACRDNPLKSKGRSIGNARGLSAIEAPKGQMIVYSASRGQQALDRLLEKDPNPNSVFTRELLARMKNPGVKIEDLMRDVQSSVEELAKSVKHEQRPAIYNETRGNFYFYNFGQNQQASPPENSAAFMLEKKEDKFWEDAKLLGNKEALEAYLKQYPRGRYAALANAYLIRLQSSASSLTSQPISNPLSSGMAIPSSQNPSSPNSGGDADCDRLSETSTISSNMAKDNNRNPANVVVTSSHARTKNHNVQTPINCNRDK
jgi:Caspase domain